MQDHHHASVARKKAAGGGSSVTEGTDLVYRWPLASDANASHGGVNLTNNGTTTFPDGALFDAGTKYLSGTITQPSPSWSASFWIKPTSTSASRSVPFIVGTGGDANDWGVQFKSDDNAYYESGAGTNQGCYVSSEWNSTNYPSDEFTLVVITWDGANFKAYRNTTLLDTESRSAPTAPETALNIGNDSTADRPFPGYIKDVRVYERALDATAIGNIHTAGPEA
jgi:hypothetical protein